MLSNLEENDSSVMEECPFSLYFSGVLEFLGNELIPPVDDNLVPFLLTTLFCLGSGGAFKYSPLKALSSSTASTAMLSKSPS